METAKNTDTQSSSGLRLPVAIRNLAWLLLAAAILQRYVLKLGESPKDVTLITVGLLFLALAARVVAWRLVKIRERGTGNGRRPDR